MRGYCIYMTNTCTLCGASVVWATSKTTGKTYLTNVTSAYDNGARYLRGPHFKTCDKGARLAELASEERARHAKDVRRQAVLRYLSVYNVPMPVADDLHTRLMAYMVSGRHASV